MATFYVSTERVARNPVRVQTWNASIRAGDDFKLAMTVYGDDNGTPAVVTGSASLLALWHDGAGYPHSCDYGLGWATGGSAVPGIGVALVRSSGYVTPVRGGGINFSLSGAQTAMLTGRYRLVVMVDLPDGSFSQFEGILQIRGTRSQYGVPLLIHTSGVFMTLDVSQLDNAILAALVVNGVPTDQDGFPLLIITGVGGDLTVDALTQLILSLPTTLPDGAGVLWLDGGVLAIS
jgi:hypothetical protein